MKTIRLIFITTLLLQAFISTGQTEDCLIDEFENTLNSQSSNSCTPNPNYSYSIDPAFLAAFPEETIAVHFWAINRTDGTSDNPYTLTKLQESVDLLNSEFANMNICFELVGFDIINDDSIYFNSAGALTSYVSQNPSSTNDNAVNIYIPYRFTNFNNNLRGFMFGWNSFGYNKMAVNSFEYNTGIFIHEMGHVFGLRHTHQNHNVASCERVTRDPNDPDYNAKCAGDYVIDTESMINLNNNTALIDNNCNYVGPSYSDCGGTPYTFGTNEIRNYMSYTLQHCRDRFTIGQGVRAREYFLATSLTQNFRQTPNEDLFTINSTEDVGLEPDNFTNVIWESPDIWVRNQPDGFTNQTHEDLQYVDDNTPVYVYVKIRNRGCEASGGNDNLELYWAKGGLNQDWEDVWKGFSNPPNGLDIGNPVGTQTIPSVDSGQETILEFEWQPLNPTTYSDAGFNKPWMFCFLSRIDSAEDPMAFTEVTNAGTNTRNNNNIAYKNTTVLDISGDIDIGSIIAGNFNPDQTIVSDITFFTNVDNAIWDESEIRVTLNESLWEAWQNSGGESTDVRILNSNTREIYLAGNNSSLDNITFESNEWGILTPRINFLIREVTGQSYTLNVSQNNSQTNEILGGFTYHINRNSSRQYFQAEASLSESNHITTLEADSINENATYNWYDENGDYISSGTTLIINNSSEKEFKLEIIAEIDGHKDYETLTAKENRSILSLTPNPTINMLTIDYNIGSANSAFIQITNVNTGLQNNYLLNLNSNSKLIDITNQPSGQYVVNLVTDNAIVDTKNLIKN